MGRHSVMQKSIYHYAVIYQNQSCSIFKEYIFCGHIIFCVAVFNLLHSKFVSHGCCKLNLSWRKTLAIRKSLFLSASCNADTNSFPVFCSSVLGAKLSSDAWLENDLAGLLFSLMLNLNLFQCPNIVIMSKS